MRILWLGNDRGCASTNVAMYVRDDIWVKQFSKLKN